MTVTIDLDEADSIHLTETLERRPPDQLEFAIEGTLTVTEALLAEFEGATLDPVRITVSTDDSDPVEIDLTGPATLRLENADVGVATPDADDVPTSLDALRTSAGDDFESIKSPPDVIAFTIEGVIQDVPTATLEVIADETPEIESVTFAVEESVRSDGGSGNDVIFELTLLGYGIVVRRDGTIVVGCHGSPPDIDLP
ncbi:hypothetical protein HYG81_03070 [Natrinema zhouii]|uniref:Uncharacterized protein n=1 Tax=Natrinema zhouii TaxID=1710539 RepID=A0A7D6CS91_9EURY|nr:hypothetical protein [Natrinema zhouii]QLK26613.1 hypothetical protein HYG81_03070 [Natrinema zhouii]